MKKKNISNTYTPAVEHITVEKRPPEVEEKRNRYNYQDIDTVPRSGAMVILSETGEDAGEAAFWKKTRAFANATHKWEETGFFVSNITSLPIVFKPKFWRMRGMYEI